MNIDWIQRELENGSTLLVCIQHGVAVATLERDGFHKTVQMLDNKAINAIGSLNELMKQDAMDECYPPNAKNEGLTAPGGNND